MAPHMNEIVEKLNSLPPERIAEVEDFIDFLKQRDDDQQWVQRAMRASEASLNRIWDNDDDAEYDNL
jgi:hypothetical protein